MANSILTNCAAMALAMAFAIPGSVFAQERFDSADAAVQAVIDAASKHDGARLAAIFGPQGNAILTSGNAAQDKAEQAEFSRLAGMKHQLEPDKRDPNRVILSIGNEDWPFPVPIVRTDGKWRFDASQTKVEMQARKIGAHELDAIEICAGYVDAQRKFASEDRDKDGMLDYAPRIAGLEPLVPHGLTEAAWAELKQKAKPYHGYYFRILEGQGANAPGGAHNYMAKNKLIGGFGLVAWPAEYGVTGILTFIVNQDGVVYEKDIAPPISISSYDPDPSWKPVD